MLKQLKALPFIMTNLQLMNDIVRYGILTVRDLRHAAQT